MKPAFLSHIQTDLSRVQKGDWFFPMTIKEVNQHALVDQALQKGAVGFTYEEDFASLLPQTSLSASHDSVLNLREHLFSLAQKRRPELSAQVAVIAGSAGKTSVKELVGAILKSYVAENSFMSPDNQNTKIALATQVLRLPETCKYAVFEMGARRMQDFKIPLSYLQPQVVALLNIGTAHIGEFGSRENLWKEKLSCLNAPCARYLVVPGDVPDILTYAQDIKKPLITFGFDKQNDVQIVSETASELNLKVRGVDVQLHCPFHSSAKALNVAASVAVAIALDIPLHQVQKALESFKGTARRFQSFDWQGTAAIDDAFNASPESLYAGLQELRKLSLNKRVLLVLGSMLELSDETERAHRAVAHQVQKLFSESLGSGSLSLATVGSEAGLIADEWRQLHLPAVFVKEYATSLEARELASLKNDFDLIYFKGSKSIQLQKIFEATT